MTSDHSIPPRTLLAVIQEQPGIGVAELARRIERLSPQQMAALEAAICPLREIARP